MKEKKDTAVSAFMTIIHEKSKNSGHNYLDVLFGFGLFTKESFFAYLTV